MESKPFWYLPARATVTVKRNAINKASIGGFYIPVFSYLFLPLYLAFGSNKGDSARLEKQVG